MPLRCGFCGIVRLELPTCGLETGGGERLTNSPIASFAITAFVISSFVSGFEEGRGDRRLRVFSVSAAVGDFLSGRVSPLPPCSD